MSTTEQGTSHYDLLNVPPEASSEDIKKAYRKLAKRLHPDVAGPGMESLFAQVTRAYEVLSDPERRAQYDAIRNAPEPEPEPEPEPWGAEDVVIEDPEPAPAPQPPLGDDDLPPPPPPPPSVPPLPPLSEKAAKRDKILRMLAWGSIPALLVYSVAIQWIVMLMPGGAWYFQQTEVIGWIVFLTPLMLLRIFRKRGKVSLGLMIGTTLLILTMGELPGVGAALLCIATAEVWRRHRRRSKRQALAFEWHVFRTWASERELFVLSVAPQGQRTLALVQDPYTMDRQQVMVWGVVRSGEWIVLDASRAVIASCSDSARAAWESLYV